MNKYAYSLILSLAALNMPIVNGSDYLSSDDEIEAPRVERAAVVAHGKKRLTEEQIEALKEAGAAKREERRLAREIMASHPKKQKVVAQRDDLVGELLKVQKEEVQIQAPILENQHTSKSNSDEDVEASATLVDKLLQKPQAKKKKQKYDASTMKKIRADKAAIKRKSLTINKARDKKFASAQYE
ncbi:MAG: hypothetical protein NT128_00995 [Proteobacteria bacterium]|nr:hypothetical protein [Pseudomonadota bacterium]